MRIERIELRKVALPLVSPFTTSFGSVTLKEIGLVAVYSDGVVGWGECAALPDPIYSPEYTDGALAVLERYLAPRLLGRDVTAANVSNLFTGIVGHRMAKGALEMAVIDAELRAAGRSFASYLGVTRARVPAGVSVGIMDTIPQLVEAVGGYLAEGYRRIKLKIKPGWDLAPVAAIREAFGDEVPLQVDANTAYTLGDAAHLAKLDRFGLLLIEQPLGEEDLRQHALLARQVLTPICLDESVVSPEAAADAIAMRATSVINIKAARVGGYLAAVKVHDIARANGIPVWCGGMVETGLGRRANAALAGLPGFTLVGDVSASSRFYSQDLTEPVEMVDGHIAVPQGPGIGPAPLPDVLAAVTMQAVAL
ncbi:MAG: o-succinylbenzoate synthase [Bifidobacteriaceae bacterium]|jgi:O-succinylbenzoate synthase|nr:o-succinylbenzoate synthase [Bifidobacteriaceae bacterium]